MISKDEFEKINYSVKYIWEASRRNPSHERNLLTFARFFDPSSGLKYFLRTMGDHNYSSAKEEEYAASELFNSSIAPVSLKEQIARFLTQYFSSEDLITTGLSRSPVDVKLKATQDFIALLCEEIQQAFSLYYTPLQSESAKDMARYFQIAIFMNLVSFNNDLAQETKDLFAEAFNQTRKMSEDLPQKDVITSIGQPRRLSLFFKASRTPKGLDSEPSQTKLFSPDMG